MTKLNLGCGEKHLEGYINCDIDPKVKPDIILNLNEKFPFKDEEVTYILMDNVLEHVGLKCFDEIHRTLKRNGLVYIIIPNFFRWKARIHYALKGRLEDSDGWYSNHTVIVSYQDFRAILRSKGFDVPYKSFLETLFMPEINITIRKRV